MPRKAFAFYVEELESELRDFIEAHSNVAKFIKEIIDDFRKGKLVKIDELQRKKLETDIRYKEIMIEIKKKELLHYEVFDKSPSYSGKKAIKVAVNTESYSPPEEKKVDDIIKNNWNRFVDTLKQNAKSEWILTCKLCSTGFVNPSHDQVCDRFKTHLEETHTEDLMKL